MNKGRQRPFAAIVPTGATFRMVGSGTMLLRSHTASSEKKAMKLVYALVLIALPFRVTHLLRDAKLAEESRGGKRGTLATTHWRRWDRDARAGL
jgi:hypothetical protein